MVLFKQANYFDYTTNIQSAIVIMNTAEKERRKGKTATKTKNP